MNRITQTPRRHGFTLVEMLVVVGIITLLATILVMAIGQAGVKARQDATVALIRKVSGQVQERLEAFDRLKSQPQWNNDARTYAAQYGLTNEQARIMLVKDRMKIILPQTFAEFSAADPVEYARFTTNYNSSSHVTETESSALLYYALTRGKAFGIPTIDPGEFKASEVQDTDGDGLAEFIDAWQKPLRFYRWPTRLFCPSGTPGTIDRSATAAWRPLFNGIPAAAMPDPLAKDQDDPTYLLQSTTAIQNHFTESAYHTPNTWHLFLIVSAGPDGQKTASRDTAFGLYSPTDTANRGYLAQPMTGQFDALTDNITNRNR